MLAYPVLLDTSNVNISANSSSTDLFVGDMSRLSLGNEPFVLILQLITVI